MAIKRADDYQVRREHLKNLTDAQLEERFWALAEEIINPLLDLAKNNTSPSIERSVLLRMGFSSLEAKAIVDNTIDRGLMGKGCGNIVYRVAKSLNRNYIEVGKELSEGNHWDIAMDIFKGGAK